MKFAIAIDDINDRSSDLKLLSEFADIVKSKGHEVSTHGRGPNQIQNYSLHNSSDVMVQIAGGLCVGTLSDFCYGIKTGYYHAKKACIPIYTKGWTKINPETYKPSGGAHDDNFSHGLPAAWFNQFLNITFPEMYTKFSQYLLPYSHGKSAQEMADKMLGGATNSGTNTGAGGGGGTTGFDLIKQVITPWDKYGVALELNGDTLHVYRATTKGAPLLTEDVIVNDSISITDYGSQTVNYITDGKNVLKNDFLVKRFGKIEADEKPKNKGKVWLQDMFQVAQRDSGHTIDLKVLFDPKLKEGMYVHLQLKSFDLDGYYFVSKTSVEEENCMSITLDPAPPSRYQEVTETVDTSGTNTGNGLGKDMISIGNALAAKYKFANGKLNDPGEYYKGCETYACMKEKGNGSCWAWSDALYTELNAVGIKTRIIQYPWPPYTSAHRSVQVYQNGKWVDYPYGSTNISTNAKAWAGRSSMFVFKDAP